MRAKHSERDTHEPNRETLHSHVRVSTQRHARSHEKATRRLPPKIPLNPTTTPLRRGFQPLPCSTFILTRLFKWPPINST